MSHDPKNSIVQLSSVSVATAVAHVTAMDRLSNHPEIVALREQQAAAGTLGETSESTEAMLALYRRLQAEQAAKN